MSDTESSENEASDIDECVSIAYKKFTENRFAVDTESDRIPVLSLATSASVSSEDDTLPESNKAANTSRFVTTNCLNFESIFL